MPRAERLSGDAARPLPPPGPTAPPQRPDRAPPASSHTARCVRPAGRKLRRARRGVGPRDPAPRPPPRPTPPAGPRLDRALSPAPAPALAAPGRLTLRLRRREGGGMGRTPQAAALRPTDSGSSALPAHGADQGGGLPPIRTRDCTPARWLPAGPRRSTGVHLCPNKRALTPNQDCWACPGEATTNHRRDDAPETADLAEQLLSLWEPEKSGWKSF